MHELLLPAAAVGGDIFSPTGIEWVFKNNSTNHPSSFVFPGHGINMSRSDLAKILQSIDAIREDVQMGGNYEEFVKQYERQIHLLAKMSFSSDDILQTKINELKSKLQTEIRIVNEYSREMENLTQQSQQRHSNGAGKDSETDKEENDPDVWPPPTPVPGGRGPSSGSALPVWARGRDANEKGSAPQNKSRGTPDPPNPRRQSGANSNAPPPDNSRLRRDRDNTPLAAVAPKRKDPVPQRRVSGGGAAAGGGGGAPTAGGKARVPRTSGGSNGKSALAKKAAGEAVKFSDVAREEGWADVELIETIERDIVDTKVSVSWESIAGLSEAKHLLQVGFHTSSACFNH